MENEKELKNLDLDLSTLMQALDGELNNENKQEPEVPEVEPEINNNQQNPSSENNNSPLIHFAKYLSDEGIFAEQDVEDFDGTPDGLAKKITQLADRLAEQKTQNYSPEAKKFIELINAGLNESEAKKIVTEQKSIKSITDEDLESNVDIQKQIIRDYLTKTGVPEEDIDEQITFFEDTDKLYQKSLNHFTKLKSIAEKEEETAKTRADTERKAMEAQYQKQLEDIKERIDKTKEIIPGFALTQVMKEKIYKNITTPAKVVDGVPVSAVALKREKDPVQFEITLNLLNELGVFDGKYDLLLNAGKKKSVEELEKAIETSDFFNRSSNKKQEDKTKEIINSISELPNFKI